MSKDAEIAYLRELVARFRSSHRQSAIERRCFCNLCNHADDLGIVPLSEHGDMAHDRRAFDEHLSPEQEAAYHRWDDAWWRWHREEEMSA